MSEMSEILGSVHIKSIQPIGPDEEFEGKHITGKIFPSGTIHIVPASQRVQAVMPGLMTGLAKQIGVSPEFIPEVDSWFIDGPSVDSEDIDAFLDALDTMIDEKL